MTTRKEHTPWSRRDAALRKARAASATPEIAGEMEAPVVARRGAKRRDTIAPYKRSSSSGVSVAGSSVTRAEDAISGIDTPRRCAPPLLLEGTPAGEAPVAKVFTTTEDRSESEPSVVARRGAKRRDAIAPYKPSSSSGVSVAGSSVTRAEDAISGIDTPRRCAPPLLLEGTPAGEAPVAEVFTTPEDRSQSEPPVVVPRPVAVRLATIDDLRGLAEEWRGRIVDFVTSGAPISTLRRMLEAEQGLRFTEDAPVVEFYQEEARRRWQNTFDTASADADAMINVLRHSDLDFSEVLLKALGQQAFRMITQRELNTKQVEKFTRLLLQARGQDVSRTRAKEALALQREKMERQFQSDLEKALNALAEEIKAHPEVRESFVFFRAKLRDALRKKPQMKKTEESTEGGRSADDADLHRLKGEEKPNEIPSENLRSSAQSADGSLPS